MSCVRVSGSALLLMWYCKWYFVGYLIHGISTMAAMVGEDDGFMENEVNQMHIIRHYHNVECNYI